MEEQAVYLTNNNTRAVPQTFTIQILHISMVSELVARGIGKNASEVVRKAIEAYYASLDQVEA